MGVVLAVVRGILNATLVYVYGDELDYVMGAHLVALLLKK